MSVPEDINEVALLFSGGTDSLSLFYSCIDLGIKTNLYTYCLEGFESEDLKVAKKIEEKYGINLTVCYIENNIEKLIEDVFHLLGMRISGKVNIQCMHGHMYVAPKIKEQYCLNGSGIDGIYGTYKEYFMGESKTNKEVFDQLRIKHLNNPNDDAMQYQYDLYKSFGIETLYPYRQPNVIDYLMKLSWSEINKPKFKNICVQDFPEIINDGLYRQRGSQQIISGTREFHDKLLNTKYNTKNYKRVGSVYKQMNKLINMIRL